MALSREEVVWAYRMILGREPESEAAIGDNLRVGDLPTLRRAFAANPEARGLFAATRPSSPYRDAGRAAIDTDGGAADIAAMLARIAEAWRRFGETEPHWSVLTGAPFKADSIAANLEPFYASGGPDVAELLGPLARAGLATAGFARVLDFGCGVGRLALSLASRAEEVVGVDISPPHLRLAAERAGATGIGNVRFAAIDRVEELDAFAGFDLITSLIVLQHNPPPVIAVILRKLLAALAPGGVAVFQVPTFLPGYAFSIASYLASAQPPMEMNAIPQHAVFRIVAEQACDMLEVREDGRVDDLNGVSQIFAARRR